MIINYQLCIWYDVLSVFVVIFRLWKEVKLWRDEFLKHDRDQSGFLNPEELESLFKAISKNMSTLCTYACWLMFCWFLEYKVRKSLLGVIAMRYGGKDKRITFSDFVLAASKLSVQLCAYELKIIQLTPIDFSVKCKKIYLLKAPSS